MDERNREETDAELVACARRGDRGAFAELVRRYERAAYATALSFLDDRESAEDAVQDALVNAYGSLGGLREPARFGPWFREIVRRRALEILRRARTVRFTSDETRAAFAGLTRLSAAQHEDTGLARDLGEALAHLPPRQREAVLACYMKDFTYERAAEYLGISLSTLKGRLQLARERLRTTLGAGDIAPAGGVRMDTEKIERTVGDAVARIATTEIDARMPLDGTRRFAFFGGVPCEVEVCQTDGDAVIITGTATAAGTSLAEAERALGDIRLETDQENMANVMRDAMIFDGVNTDRKGDHTASGMPGWVALTEHIRIPLATRAAFPYARHYPELGALRDPSIADAIQDGIGGSGGNGKLATLFRTRLHGITIPKDQATGDVRRGLMVGYSDQNVVFGAAGTANLVIAIPAGTTITLYGPTRIVARGVRGDVNVIGGTVTADECSVTVEDVDGSVRLFNAPLESARNIRGDVALVDLQMRGEDGSGRRMRRAGVMKTTIADVAGDVSFDCGRVDLEISGVAGRIDGRNRWGSTRVHVAEAGRKCRIESDSGEVIVFLKEAVAGDASVVVNTICGEIRHDALGEGPHSRRSNRFVMGLGTVAEAIFAIDQGRTDYAADIVVTTRDGNVAFEKTK